MSSSQYFSNNPRNFEHQKVHPAYPLELNGKSKQRVSGSLSSLGKWDLLMAKSPESSKNNQRNRPFSHTDSQRTIIPTKNTDSVRSPSIKCYKLSANEPGSFQSLMRSDESKKGIKTHDYLNANTESKETIPKRSTRHCPLKTYDYDSQIKSIPVGSNNRKPMNDLSLYPHTQKSTKSVMTKIDKDYKSSIVSVPGFDSMKKQDHESPRFQKENYIHRFTVTTPEMNILKNVDENKKQARIPIRTIDNARKEKIGADISMKANDKKMEIFTNSNNEQALQRKGKVAVNKDLFKSYFTLG